jgi:hypothetical protein
MGIANELITRGWHQGDFRADDGSVCLYGACVAAERGAAFDALDIDDIALANGGEYEKALSLLVVGQTGHTVAAWNDDPSRTFDEVLRAAKEADEIVDAL